MTTDLTGLCRKLDCDEQLARGLLETARDLPAHRVLPWYARLLIGLGAWITALVTVALGVAVLALGLDIARFEGVPLAMLGSALFALGLLLLHGRASARIFVYQIAIAFAAAGACMIAAGVGFATDELWVAALASVVLLGLVIELADSDVLQFLTALLTIALVLVTLVFERLPLFVDLASITIPLGLLLLLRPPRIDLRPTAVVLLLTTPLLGLYVRMPWGTIDLPDPGGWVARPIGVASFLYVIVMLWRRADSSALRRRYAGVAGGAAITAVLLPPGGSAALVMMLVGYALGSCALSILGSLVFVGFLWQFYYDLQLTLLVKSLILMGAGVVLIVLWRVLAPHLASREAA